MGSSVETPVETSMESAMASRNGPVSAPQIRLLGTLAIIREGVQLKLPASRKVRALFAYLALARQPLNRSHLCELLWDIPNDPRGELRWSLSKIRGLLDEVGQGQIVAHDDLVALDLKTCRIDVTEIMAASAEGIDKLPAERLSALSWLFAGDFLDGLDIDRSPLFDNWLAAQRRRFRAAHVAVLEHLVKHIAASEEVFPHLDKWIELAPFDRHAHLALLTALAERGRFRECDEHLAVAARRFAADEVDIAPLTAAWRKDADEERASSSSAVDPSHCWRA